MMHAIALIKVTKGYVRTPVPYSICFKIGHGFVGQQSLMSGHAVCDPQVVGQENGDRNASCSKSIDWNTKKMAPRAPAFIHLAVTS